MRFLRSLCVASAALVALPTGASAQQSPAPARPGFQAKVDVVVSRFEGEKKASSLPFTLWVDIPGPRTVGNSSPPPPWGTASLRMGVDVPIGTKGSTSAQTLGNTTTTDQKNTTQYRNVGTSIDCRLSQLEDGRFQVSVSVEDSSIYTPGAPGRGTPRITDPLAFRTFSLNNALPMRDGQTLQYATATDKISGETVKVDVTFNVVK